LKSRTNLDDDDYAENLSIDCLTIAANYFVAEELGLQPKWQRPIEKEKLLINVKRRLERTPNDGVLIA